VTGPVVIRVSGRPAPQGSKRHVGNGRMVEMSKAVGPWREAVRAETQLEMWTQGRGGSPLEGPVSVRLRFWLARPVSHYGTGRNRAVVKPSAPRRPAGRPDVDKLARAVLDGLTMGGAFADDSQVVDLQASKWYVADGDAAGCVITVEVPGA
jgi:crossover junction endodeoxyribonuclease RusA